LFVAAAVPQMGQKTLRNWNGPENALPPLFESLENDCFIGSVNSIGR
jgi:hypothetical protein